MGKLLAHNGSGCAEPRQYGHCEGSADSETIDEVVQRVTQSYHPRHCLDAGDLGPTQPVAHHTRRQDVLEECRDSFEICQKTRKEMSMSKTNRPKKHQVCRHGLYPRVEYPVRHLRNNVIGIFSNSQTGD